MSDTDEQTRSLYDRVAEAFGTPFDKDGEDSVDEWKENAVRHFNDLADDDFNSLDEDIAAWVNEAAEVMKKNRGSRRKSALPTLDGLDEESEEEEKPKSKRGRKPKGEKAEKPKKEPKGRDRTANRYYRAAVVMIDNPGISQEDLMKKLAASGHDYSEVTVSRAFDAYDNITAALKDKEKLD